MSIKSILALSLFCVFNVSAEDTFIDSECAYDEKPARELRIDLDYFPNQIIVIPKSWNIPDSDMQSKYTDLSCADAAKIAKDS